MAFETQDFPKKIKLPESMPPFSSNNPVQALYLKKKGVERLLARSAGKTVNLDFAKETKIKIEMESMLIDRSGEHARKNYCEDDSENGIQQGEPFTSAEKIPQEVAVSDDDNECPELSYYDSEEDSDWSLPGIEEVSTDIRYVYSTGDNNDNQLYAYQEGDFNDSQRRERQITIANEDEQEKSTSMNSMEYIASYFSLDNLMIYDWIRCI
jgi:hypothetical protein